MSSNQPFFNAPLIAADAGHVVVANATDGTEGLFAARYAKQINAPVYFVARDGAHIADLAQVIKFEAPDIDVVQFPAWDCLPYDRVSPSAEVSAQRMAALVKMGALRAKPRASIILTSPNAIIQRIPKLSAIAKQIFSAKPGQSTSMDDITRRMAIIGFERVSTVREVGEYTVRGGILDIFAPGSKAPVRLDFFGNTLESIRAFDAATQRTIKPLKAFNLRPMSEVTLNSQTVTRFRTSYIEKFGAPQRGDTLYESIAAKQRFAGMEHWMPLFYEVLDCPLMIMPDAPVMFEHLAKDAITERRKQIDDHYDSRLSSLEAQTGKNAVPYKPLEPDMLYIADNELQSQLTARAHIDLTPFDQPESNTRHTVSLDTKTGKNFAAERATPDTNVFEIAAHFIADERAEGRTTLLTGWSEGSLDRLRQILEEHGLGGFQSIQQSSDIFNLEHGVTATAVLNIEHGFETEKFVVMGEQDILGDRLVRRRRKKKASDFISEVASLNVDDLVVHVDHGIGRFAGLKTINVTGAPHDCLEIHYHGDDRLFLPVENIELLSRYGSDSAEAQLDRLGGSAWQSRKAKLKKQLLEMAGQLINIAAQRQLRNAPVMRVPDGLYDEFAARFPYNETDDQLQAIDAVIDDLSQGRPMDRLVCGDVGFGKTEVALRAAFVAAMNGVQVAVVVPTTLLARQHFKSFSERFAGLPLKVAHASRLAGPKTLSEAKAGIADGTVDIVVGTHALLGNAIKFKDLGLLIIDEEQRFGVKHKERLKEMKTDVHVLTLSATPIPRTMQLALTGVRELSLITTAPVDRLAVRTFISPFDPLIIRETLLRERYRGGQSFYVCPRISDMEDVKAFLDSDVPELKVAMAHGQMTPGELEDIMNAFYEGQYDVLLSTTIVESGLDIPTANTLVVHRADMFGLAQLYQIRGRVGRSKLRAHALFTLPVNQTMTKTAERRLKVLQTLDSLGAGFQLASHDLDIRGAGNLLGDEQSGHIKEVGFELYQQMLEEAVAEFKGEEADDNKEWSPQITIGTPVMIPESYVTDLSLRLSLYRRLGNVEDAQEIDAFGAEMVDRFGPMPEELQHLLKIVYIKALCRKANVEKIDAGPKGAVVTFRNAQFADPAALVKWIGDQGTLARIRPDQSIVFARDWPAAEKRLNGTAVIINNLAKLAKESGQ